MIKPTLFLDYFETTIDYPQEKVFNPLPMDELWNYVSTSYLDGFINFVQIVKGFVIARYRQWNEPLSKPVIININIDQKWCKKEFNTKREIFDAITITNAIVHPKLHDFKDDVVILTKAFNKDNTQFCWVFFWYDCDVSDCSIGRFQTEDSDEIVIEKFKTYVKSCNDPTLGETEQEIPSSYFNSGWING